MFCGNLLYIFKIVLILFFIFFVSEKLELVHSDQQEGEGVFCCWGEGMLSKHCLTLEGPASQRKYGIGSSGIGPNPTLSETQKSAPLPVWWEMSTVIYRCFTLPRKKYHAGIRLEIVSNFDLIFSLYSLVFLIFILFVLFVGRKDMNNTISFGDFREDT